MSTFNTISRRIVQIALASSLTACAGSLGFSGDSWKEEVLLHDGSKIIVKRSQSYGGLHELGQPSPIKEHTLSFSIPGSNKTITWTSEYGEDLGRTNFNVLALHILNGTPYLVVEPNLCLSYNKWGRPNPPYVVFKYDGKEWQRIPLTDLPSEFKTVNLDFRMTWNIRDRDVVFDKGGMLSAETIKRHNEETRQPEYRTILREPRAKERINEMCEERVLYKGYWILPNDQVARKIIDQRNK